MLFLLLPTQHPPLSLLPQQQLEHYSEMLVFITAKRSECGGGFNDFSLSALSVAIRWTRTRSQFGKSGSVGGGEMCVHRGPRSLAEADELGKSQSRRRSSQHAARPVPANQGHMCLDFGHTERAKVEMSGETRSHRSDLINDRFCWLAKASQIFFPPRRQIKER